MTTHTGTDPYIERTDLFIDGDWQPPLSTETYTVVSPATEEPIGRVPIASAKDVDRAVAAARRAFEGPGSPWAATTPAERAEVMERLADALCARTEELARLITRENGMPIAMSPRANVHSPVGILRYYAGLARGVEWEERRPAFASGSTLVRREPVGVVGAIVPWNYPQALAMMKIAPRSLRAAR